jgi:hypothetical protein
MKKILTNEQEAIRQQFQAHIDAEIRGDLDSTLSTMTANPHLNNIPTLIGGIGQDAVRSFYSKLIPVNKFFPADTEMVPVSQTIDQNHHFHLFLRSTGFLIPLCLVKWFDNGLQKFGRYFRAKSFQPIGRFSFGKARCQ